MFADNSIIRGLNSRILSTRPRGISSRIVAHANRCAGRLTAIGRGSRKSRPDHPRTVPDMIYDIRGEQLNRLLFEDYTAARRSEGSHSITRGYRTNILRTANCPRPAVFTYFVICIRAARIRGLFATGTFLRGNHRLLAFTARRDWSFTTIYGVRRSTRRERPLRRMNDRGGSRDEEMLESEQRFSNSSHCILVDF